MPVLISLCSDLRFFALDKSEHLQDVGEVKADGATEANFGQRVEMER